jgi:hypothetical protein
MVAIDSGRWRHGEAGKPVGEHRGGVGARFEGSGEDGGSPGDRSMAVHLGGGETTVRGSSGGVGGVVDSLRGRKYLLGSDAGYPRAAATGLNRQLVGARSRGAWQLGG